MPGGEGVVMLWRGQLWKRNEVDRMDERQFVTIDEKEIEGALLAAGRCDAARVREVLAKVRELFHAIPARAQNGAGLLASRNRRRAPMFWSATPPDMSGSSCVYCAPRSMSGAEADDRGRPFCSTPVRVWRHCQ